MQIGKKLLICDSGVNIRLKEDGRFSQNILEPMNHHIDCMQS